MRRIAALLPIATLAGALGCANSTAQQSSEPIMRLTLQMRGSMDISSPNIRYFIVLNTATQADQPGISPAEAEAASAAGVNPTSGQPAGPRIYGPLPIIRPRSGWDLPFFLSGPNVPADNPDPRRTREWTGTAPLLPVTWTDYFLLRNEGGTVRLTHSQHPNPVSNPSLILQDVENLQQGQDWFVDRSSLVLLIRLRTLLNGSNLVPATPGATPPGTFVTANFVTANTEGQIIDRWTLSENEPGVTLRTTLRSQDQNQQFRPNVLFPLNKPSGVSDDAVNLASFNSEIRQ